MKQETPIIKSKSSLVIVLMLLTIMIVFSIRYPGPDTAFICLNSAPGWLVIGYQHYFARVWK